MHVALLRTAQTLEFGVLPLRRPEVYQARARERLVVVSRPCPVLPLGRGALREAERELLVRRPTPSKPRRAPVIRNEVKVKRLVNKLVATRLPQDCSVLTCPASKLVWPSWVRRRSRRGWCAGWDDDASSAGPDITFEGILRVDDFTLVCADSNATWPYAWEEEVDSGVQSTHRLPNACDLLTVLIVLAPVCQGSLAALCFCSWWKPNRAVWNALLDVHHPGELQTQNVTGPVARGRGEALSVLSLPCHQRTTFAPSKAGGWETDGANPGDSGYGVWCLLAGFQWGGG